MKVDEISREEQAPEVEDLIPEVREIERRRRMRLAVVLALLLAIVLMVALLAAIGGRDLRHHCLTECSDQLRANRWRRPTSLAGSRRSRTSTFKV